ncbi:cyclase family protein [Pseudorhodobacter sp. W20_MBD10_FR17]|uniref:cyclase family protein n=1 Tax=Pseudorhodobacter sp. W20_MBD10_FR17 TaxID=3240266 RepID=UPI003F9A8106
MAGVTEAASGLCFYELSHEWGHGTPSMPGDADVVMYRSVKHAQHGVMAHRMKMVMHSGTHLNAPMHMIQNGVGVGGVDLGLLFGNGVILSIPKGPWGVIEVADLEAASPEIQQGDRVVIVTGWHAKYSDSLEYFGDAPGLSKAAAEWLVARKVKLVAIDTPQIDHPLATSLISHRGGPLMNRLERKYKSETGRDAKTDHPDWNIAHRTLLAAGIPTVENVGGEVDALLGQRACLHAAPWRWMEGDACVIRFVAITDPSGAARIESGKMQKEA